MWVGLSIALLAFTASSALAETVTELPGLFREPLSLTITAPDGITKTLEALVVRPEGSGRFPLALITHGLPRTWTDIPAQRPQTYFSPAIAFAQHGYAAVIVMRSGYGHSTGTFAEAVGPCENRNYVKAGQAGGADVLAALRLLQNEPWVDPGQVVLVGASMGGFAVLAAVATDPAGVRGAISFAGAVGSPRPDYVCQPDRLVEADRVFGRTTHIPSLWIFAENDHFFGPGLARDMFGAFTEAGAPGSLYIAPPYRRDGHVLIGAAPDATWWPRVATFLAAVQLPTQVVVQLPPPAELAEPYPLNSEGREAFQVYKVSRGYEKAFAVDPAGHYGMAFGQRTMVGAEQAALHECQVEERVCRVYAVGNDRTHSMRQ